MEGEVDKQNLSGHMKESGNGKSVGGGGAGDGFVDRSKVRILLCDNDAKSSQEVFTLLLKCSYQVTSVRSARQVIDALNADGPEIDIILSEVDIPMTKGMKMLKYIMRDKDLRRIPVIMMSAQDEVSIVVKCLRLGAADYLVKPLRTNELLNLWTHMWRRRRMLGLVEKDILNYDFDLVASDHSDANTNSTTLFSDDTDDWSRRSTNPEMGMSIHQEDESAAAASSSAAAAVEPSPGNPQKYRPDVPGISDRRTGNLSSGPKKSELKIGGSSAFFTYVKSGTVKNNSQGVALIEDNTNQNSRMEEKIGGSSAFFTYVKSGTVKNNSQGVALIEDNTNQNSRMEEKLQLCGQQLVNDTHLQENGETLESYSQGDDFRSCTSVPDSLSLERSCTPPMSSEFSQRNFKEDGVHMHQINEPQLDASSLTAQSVYPYFMSGVVNQAMMSSSAQLYQKNLHELQSHGTSAMLPRYNHLPQCPPHMSGMPPFPYYPFSVCLQPGQVPTAPSWPSFGTSTSSDVKLNKVDRREAALIKFRQKRKERCFDKKIRYVNRKKLAERRPRVRGQFVRKVNGVNVDLNGQPASTDYDEDEEEEDDEQASRDSSPEDDASGSEYQVADK